MHLGEFGASVSGGDKNLVKIVRFSKSLVDEAWMVLEEGLGQGFISREELLKYASEGVNGGSFVSCSRIAYAAVQVDGDIVTVVGVVTADHVRNVQGLVESVPSSVREKFLSRVPEVKYTDAALLRSVAVSLGVQGKGVGSALVAEAVNSLRRQGAETIVSVGWTDEEGCHIQGTLERAGFVSCGDIAGYWTDDSIEKQYDCPSCGNPCGCSARIFGMFGVGLPRAQR